MLERFGYSVTSTTCSIEAFEIFKKNPNAYDLLITDMTMPDMTGEILAKKIMASTPEIPVILCTGYSDKIDEEKAKKIGVRSYVMKPIVMSDLAKTIRDVMDGEK
jgi:two-component system, cell cycle sensor histidine kinase and response regulator CckA